MNPPTIDEHTLKIFQEAFFVKLKHIRKSRLDKPTINRLIGRVIKQVVDDYKPLIEKLKETTIQERIQEDLLRNRGVYL